MELTVEQKLAKSQTQKVAAVKLKRFKYRMEIIRTACAIVALVLNMLVLTHVLKLW